MDDDEKYRDINSLLNRLTKEVSYEGGVYRLDEIFGKQLVKLGITKHQASKILDIDPKTLDSVILGEAKKIDFITIQKLSYFLDISADTLISTYMDLVNNTHDESIMQAKKRSFLITHFNLPSLKKIGFIDSINDFEEIEKRVNTFFGYNDVFEHKNHKLNAAFSSTNRQTNSENLMFWYAAARQSLAKTPNPFKYDREKLKSYFPEIRWHSMNVQRGLVSVANSLYKLGVTLIIIPKFTPDFHFRGATLDYNGTPCIVLTKYTKFYATMWFALIHELFHVLYDWDKIMGTGYHLSEEDRSEDPNEKDADKFARQYLFPDEKMNMVKNRIHDAGFIVEYAERNHVHPSLIYTFYCWDFGGDRTYAQFYKYMTPDFSTVLTSFHDYDFAKFVPISEVSKIRNRQLFK
jgi:hypothetical protein